MRVLIIGSGGREHAFAHAISRSPALDALFVAPGNAGILELASGVELDPADQAAVTHFCQAEAIDLVLIGPEAPLVEGLADSLRAAGIAVLGPSKAAAQLEGSKAFVKKLALDNGIPTAASETHDSAATALAALDRFSLPVVVKADGLAAGKGVIIAETRDAAEAAIRACFDGAFGAAGSRVVVEDFLRGEEISCFALCDGTDYRWLGSAQDHKRVGEGDTGPNTGGMGAYTPAPCLTPALEARVKAEIIEPSLEAMTRDGLPFQGILFAGIMLTARGPELLEYNVRLGDPEAQVILPLLGARALDLFYAAATGQLAALDQTIALEDQHALTVVMAAKGYPDAYEKGSIITLPERAEDVIIFHAGTRREGESLRANGGRVLAVTGLGDSLEQARDRAYAAVDAVHWPEGFCRRDIGWRALGPGASTASPSTTPSASPSSQP